MAAKKRPVQQNYDNPPETLDEHLFWGIVPDDEQKKFIDAVWKREKKLFFVDSIAGSGKTLISTALGALMVKYGLYDKIIYVTFPGIYEKSQGFLPGDLLTKSEPYFSPLYDALVTIGELPDHVCNTSEKAVENGTAYIECAVSTYMRGININNAFVIIDEAENADLHTLAKVLSRINDDCLTIVIGHSGQCDMVDKTKSGFSACIDYNIKHHPDFCESFRLTKNHRGFVSGYADLMLEEYESPQYGFIYMTKNKVTGKLYIGQHKRTMNQKDIDDSWYLGSGKILRQAIVKYGEENFERKIIYECDSREKLNYMEKVFIEYYNAVDDDTFYNLVAGGRNGDIESVKKGSARKPMSEEARKHMARQFTDEQRKRMSESSKGKLVGYKHNDESRQNMSKSHVGSRSIYKDGIYKYVKEDTIEEYLSEGWELKGPQSGKSAVNNGIVCKMVDEAELSQYEESGWMRGRLKKT